MILTVLNLEVCQLQLGRGLREDGPRHKVHQDGALGGVGVELGHIRFHQDRQVEAPGIAAGRCRAGLAPGDGDAGGGGGGLGDTASEGEYEDGCTSHHLQPLLVFGSCVL